MNPEDIYQLIARRRTVHRYRPAKIDDSLIQQALELALMAPNHKFTFPWKFIVCGERTQKALYEMALENALRKAEVTGENVKNITQGIKEKFLNPSKIVAFVRRQSSDVKVAHEDYASIACAVQNFTIYLAGCGYGSKWSTGAVASSDMTYELLKLDRLDYVIEGLIIVGKNLLDDYPPRRRPELSQVTTHLD